MRASPLLLALAAGSLAAQDPSAILERLDRLERDNAALRQEVQALRREVAALRQDRQATAAPADEQVRIEERMAIQERRVEEHAQVKVEASERFPIRIRGMALANIFYNSRGSGGMDTPTIAARAPGPATGGATFRQSVLGLEYRGPNTLWGGKVHGALSMDFFDGFAETDYGPARLRTASIGVDWETRSILVGVEKPLFSPRDPVSYSYVGVSPLTGSGNLWRWQPQLRLEQRLHLAAATQLRAQVAFTQTSERLGYAPVESGIDLKPRRPSVQGRFEIAHRLDDTRRLEVAPAFHASTTHVNGYSVPSRLFSLDWFANPWWKLEFSGAFFTGQNVAHFGTGAIRQGFSLSPAYGAKPVHSKGGWGNVTLPVDSRVSVNIFGGIHDDRNADIYRSGIAANRSGAANLMYRLAPNVIFSLEAMQIRTTYLTSGTSTNNRYDLAVAYLF